MVTLKPTELTPPQRAPHFDTTDQKQLALLHYFARRPIRDGFFTASAQRVSSERPN